MRRYPATPHRNNRPLTAKAVAVKPALLAAIFLMAGSIAVTFAIILRSLL